MSNDALLLAAQCEASGDTTTASVMRELVAEIERLRAALKPFASVPPALLNMPELENDDPLVEPWFSTDLNITIGDLRRARDVLGESK